MSKARLSNLENSILNKIAHHSAYRKVAQDKLLDKLLPDHERIFYNEEAAIHNKELRIWRQKKDAIRRKIKGLINV